MDKHVIGIDLGGTKIATCAIDKLGNIRGRKIVPTLASKGQDVVISRIIQCVYDLLNESNLNIDDVTAIGLAAPGPLDIKNGLMTNPPNLPGWKDVPIVKILQREFKLPVVLENDANSAALGENLYGSGQGVDYFIYMTVSTGIGGGVVINNRILRGSTGNAAEFGHMVINFEGPICGCKNKGCFEAYASGTALARFARQGVIEGRKSILADMIDVEELKAEHVFSAAKKGDDFALELVRNEGFYLGIGIANMASVFDPELIAIGGGLTRQWDMFYHQMMNTAKTRLFASKDIQVVKASLDSYAGLLGIAKLAWDFVDNSLKR